MSFKGIVGMRPVLHPTPRGLAMVGKSKHKSSILHKSSIEELS